LANFLKIKKFKETRDGYRTEIRDGRDWRPEEIYPRETWLETGSR